MPLVGYYKVLTKIQVDAGNDVFPTLLNYGNWRLAWYAFLSLLDINFKGELTSKIIFSPLITEVISIILLQI